MNIKIASHSDAYELFQVMEQCLPTFDPAFCMPSTLEFFEQMINGCGIVIIAETENRIVGYAVLDLTLFHESKNVATLGLAGEEMYTANFEVCMVLKEHRGQGIQKKLMEQLLIIAKEHGRKHIYTTTHPGNKASLNNILKSGFEPKSLGKNSVGNPRLLLYRRI